MLSGFPRLLAHWQQISVAFRAEGQAGCPMPAIETPPQSVFAPPLISSVCCSGLPSVAFFAELVQNIIKAIVRLGVIFRGNHGCPP